ncbi:MAG TPA: hypothetical protein VHK69_04800, partial [Chitinophagaceae bacterium]|nr:hypothetical protein [Chitinophagaceae bacterium]
ARLMTLYTGGAVHQRYAVLAMNLAGGGGLEIWQYTSRTPQPPPVPPLLGDTGIFAVKLRCTNVPAAWSQYRSAGLNLLTEVRRSPEGHRHFFLSDPYDNLFEVVEDGYRFAARKSPVGGVCGVVIGVSCMQQALSFYQGFLGYDTVAYSGSGAYADWEGLPGNGAAERVILRQQGQPKGAFSRLLGPTTIELVQTRCRPPAKIFSGRYWGDLGFIHLCYDLSNMEAHERLCAESGFPLTINSGQSFDMGEAAGQFAYNEDPDGTLIEYVETHKVPLLKKWRWYLDLRRRDRSRALPDWMVHCMGFGKKSLKGYS